MSAKNIITKNGFVNKIHLKSFFNDSKNSVQNTKCTKDTTYKSNKSNQD